MKNKLIIFEMTRDVPLNNVRNQMMKARNFEKFDLVEAWYVGVDYGDQVSLYKFTDLMGEIVKTKITDFVYEDKLGFDTLNQKRLDCMYSMYKDNEKADYFTCIDDDDMISCEYFSEYSKCSPDADVIVVNGIDYEYQDHTEHVKKDHVMSTADLYEELQNGRLMHYFWGNFFRVDYIPRIFKFRGIKCNCFEDLLYTSYIFKYSDVVAFAYGTYYYNRSNLRSVTRTNRSGAYDLIRVCDKLYQEYMEEVANFKIVEGIKYQIDRGFIRKEDLETILVDSKPTYIDMMRKRLTEAGLL